MKHYIIMDSKQLGQLDPKLKEVYERVMGTSPHKPSSGIPIKTEPTSIPQASTTMPKIPSPATTPPITQPPSPKLFQPQPIANNIQPNPKAQPQPTAGQPTAKKQTKMTPVFIAIGSFIFIILYALIWIKLFKLDLAFLPF